MAKGPRPLSDDADATINDPNIVNDREDQVIVKTKQKPKQSALITPPASTPAPASSPAQPFSQPNLTNTNSVQPGATGINSFGSSTPNFSTPPSNFSAPAAPTNAYQQQANADMDKMILVQQQEKENENWVKAYWRPAMGWLYMVICGMDFVGFPLLTIFLPVLFQPFGLTVPYQVWTSLTLSNGGLIHLSFGAILGVAAFTRGQEKMAGKA